MKKVRCSIIFYYDPETYLHDWGDEDEFNPPSEDTIFARCKEMMLEDVTDLQNPITIEAIEAEFVEAETLENFPKHGYTCGQCEWGREGEQNRTMYDFIDHMNDTHPEVWNDRT